MDLTILIVDDEILARSRIEKLLEKTAGIDTINQCTNGREALDFLRKNTVNLMFLDVQMPEMDGFDMLHKLSPDEIPLTIFVTAYDKYALKAFDVHAVDYLLKPFDDDRFFEAFNLAREQIELKQSGSIKKKIVNIINELKDIPSKNTAAEDFSESGKYPDKLVFKESGKIHFVQADNIFYIKAAGKYLHVVSTEAEFSIRQTMTELEKKLDPAKFLRVHRSSILNSDKIKEMQHWYKSDYVFIMHNGERLFSGSTYRKNVEKILKQIC